MRSQGGGGGGGGKKEGGGGGGGGGWGGGGAYQVCDRSLPLNSWEGNVIAFEC